MQNCYFYRTNMCNVCALCLLNIVLDIASKHKQHENFKQTTMHNDSEHSAMHSRKNNYNEQIDLPRTHTNMDFYRIQKIRLADLVILYNCNTFDITVLHYLLIWWK